MRGSSPDTQQTLLGRNLIPETLTDLGGREGDTAVVEFEETAKVDEVPLRGLWAEVAEESADFLMF